MNKGNLKESFIFSKHAMERARERFPENSLDELKVYAERSRVARKKLKKRIGENCPQAYPVHMEGRFKNRYYLYNNKRNIVFVVGNGNEIITLFNLQDMER